MEKDLNGKLYSLPVRTAAVIILIVTTIITGLFGVAFIYMCSGAGYYSGADADNAFYNSELCSSLVYQKYINVYNELELSVDNGGNTERLQELIKSTDFLNTAVHIVIKDYDGNIISDIGTISDNYGYTKTYSVLIDDFNNDSADITISINKPLVDNADDFIQYKQYFDLFYSIRYTAIFITALGAITVISLYVYLMKASGRRYGENGVSEGFFDRVPYDIVFTVIILLIITILAFIGNIFNGYGWTNEISTVYGAIAYIVILSIPLLLLFIALSATTAVRAKKHTLFRNTVIWRLCVLVGKFLSFVWHGFGKLFYMMPQTVKTALLFPVILLADLILIVLCFAAYNEGFILFMLFLFIVLNITTYYFTIRKSYELNLLRRGSEQLSGGKIDYKFNEQKYHGEAQKISQNLNRLSEGLSAAVEQRSKSERMKAELITNVSHDLKTPITSIINYVDLLKKEPMQTSAAVEYLAVLDRQSARLRKLTSDLIEASKASTGNVEVTLAPTDICELLDQSAAEYTDRFTASGLTPVIRTPDDPITVNADGKLLWRVFDNLLSNICKYSQPGTRVYLDATSGQRYACVSMRNISSVQLGVTPDELTERFVRGDSSRTGEGSGLGLSIARSLTELQGGKLTLDVDGDLFKVMVTFPVTLKVIGISVQPSI
jgi:Signal transduction histidine kinase